jgi:two-component system alkaline phosphatase synthesis response regulator PhoP
MSERKKAVIVDDDQLTIDMVEEVLIPLGFQVFTAEDGKKGLELVKEKKPDLLIIDLLLPGIHGIGVCKLVKNNADIGDIKIIAMSGVYREYSCKVELGGSVDAFIKKPFSVEALELLLKKIKAI